MHVSASGCPERKQAGCSSPTYCCCHFQRNQKLFHDNLFFYYTTAWNVEALILNATLAINFIIRLQQLQTPHVYWSGYSKWQQVALNVYVWMCTYWLYIPVQDGVLLPKGDVANQFKPVVPWPHVEGVEVDLNSIRLKHGEAPFHFSKLISVEIL